MPLKLERVSPSERLRIAAASPTRVGPAERNVQRTGVNDRARFRLIGGHENGARPHGRKRGEALQTSFLNFNLCPPKEELLYRLVPIENSVRSDTVKELRLGMPRQPNKPGSRISTAGNRGFRPGKSALRPARSAAAAHPPASRSG